ncbi:cation:proton antiporter [Candidatus Poriferisodalis multihospitum]|uniref:cation:proton antiporter n=1 Tax=Candidatus Poriferisodalis multihospitum TaxID=2983191 RepID=UPI002B263211|nr:cation:proton antiporter [Candidatus Poriferisodalis multihospitum]
MLLAASAPPLFTELAILLVAGTLIAFVSSRLGVVPIVGFLAAGTVIGPSGVGLISDIDLVNQSADIGVMLLLFTLGIEFSLERVRRLASLFLIGGTVQVGLTTGIVAGVVAAFGVEWRTAVFTGLLVSLSSTAIVLKVLAERRATTSPVGNVSVALLIFQDLAIVAMVLAVPLLGGQITGPADVLIAFAKAAGIVVAVIVVARTLVPAVLQYVSRIQSGEVFLLTVLAICFGTAYATSLLDVSISLGAFLAGLMVSESRVAARALGEVMPLQILFSATFFVSIGMLLDVGYLARNLPLVVGLALAVVVVKMLTTTAAALLVRQPRAVALSGALVLAQIGEFSFVLERAGEEVGLVPAGLADGTDAFIAVTVLLMAFSPFGARWGQSLAARSDADRRARQRAHPHDGDAPQFDPSEHETLVDHAVVNGFGPRARRIVSALELAHIPYTIVSLDPEAQRWAASTGRRVLVGDVSRHVIAERAGLRDARIALAVDSPPSAVEQFARIAREHNPDIAVLAWAADPADAADLERDGLVDHVVAERQAAHDALIAHALGHFELPEPDTEAVTHAVLHTELGPDSTADDGIDDGDDAYRHEDDGADPGKSRT